MGNFGSLPFFLCHAEAQRRTRGGRGVLVKDKMLNIVITGIDSYDV
ncbi:hypothetical protein NSP_47800 [Nodularia spumigena CCY9414]|nr:hypothetical protein NSP_47800 [Nodularia spumigena CCY9414]